ncbi:MAG: Ig-like domain-containing protein, partial [Anaerolineae bacterium]|nr:Ig-like domain-containing protein [Anaerolineae bacterium]
GTLTLNPNGSFTYTPPANWAGTTTFTYQARDGDGANSNTATVTITVQNRAPAARNDFYGTSRNVPLTVAAPGVLGNDTDPDLSPEFLVAQLVAGPEHGTLEYFNSDGSFKYRPPRNFEGTDTFTYRAMDTSGAFSEARVIIRVMALVGFHAFDDAYQGEMNQPLVIPAPGVLENDVYSGPWDWFAYLVEPPPIGTLEVHGPAPWFDGGFTYIPPRGWTGTTQFFYKAVDEVGAESNVARVTITITGQNRPPSALNDGYSTFKNTALTVSAPGVLANDSDPDGDPLTAHLVQGPTHGLLEFFNPDGSFIYRPAANFAGQDSFRYRAVDPSGAFSEATVIISVQNRAPVAQEDSYCCQAYMGRGPVPELRVLAPGVLGNDWDPDPQPEQLNAQLLLPPRGTLTLYPDGSFVYRPPTFFVGTDSFLYRAVDTSGAYSSTSVVTINIPCIPENEPPVAGDDEYTLEQGTTLNTHDGQPGSLSCWQFEGLGIGSVLCNDLDPDGDELTAELLIPPAHAAAFSLRPGGGFTYTPHPWFYGTDTFGYRACDPEGACDQAVVTLVVYQKEQADVEVRKVDSPDPVVAGTTLTYTLVVTNLG